MSLRIPLFRPYVGEEEKEALSKVIDCKELSRGPFVEIFEQQFAEYVGKRYAVAVNSGTSGLHLAVKALNWKKGDLVLTTPYSFVASTNCLLYEGVKPVFKDISPVTFTLSYETIKTSLTDNIKGALLVDILGFPAITQEIRDICRDKKVTILEDACEAIGKPQKFFPVSVFSEMAVYGFYPNKQMTTGEGGMIVTDNPDLAEYLKSMRNQGYSYQQDWINYVMMGYNYRMSDIHAALGIVQLKKLDFILERRDELALKYDNQLRKYTCIKPLQNPIFKRSYFNYTILVENQHIRQKIMFEFKKRSVGYGCGFVPLHYFPHIKALGYKRGDFPIAENLAEQTLALPFYVQISDSEIEEVCQIIAEAIND